MNRILTDSARRTAILGALAVLAGLTCRDTLTNLSDTPRAPSNEGAMLSTLPTGITESMVAQNLASPTAMAVAPDGRIFIAEQGGRLRVFKNNALLSTSFLTVSVNASGERGLLGVAFDPAFASNQYVYVYYTTSSSPLHNRVSRFTANGDVAAGGSEVVILDLNNLSSATNHNGGALHFGPDGKLYIAVGDNANSANAQSMTSLFGKILRINPDGTIPSDNPFYSSNTGNYRAVWALGLRNPFTFAIHPGTGRLFINDVGENTWEEIDDGVAGSNYGWPTCESFCSPSRPNMRDPVSAYAHSGGECAITGGTFYNPSGARLLPSSYVGKYFFADYCAGWIRVLDPATGSASGFATNAGATVDLQVGTDGALYYLGRSSGRLYRVISTTTQAPVISQQPSNASVSTGQPATFTMAATGSPTLTYQWRRGGTAISGATSPTYTIATTVASDNGATFDCVVTNGYGSATTNAATLTVTNNDPPTATIDSPMAGTTYHGGQTFNYSGSGTDPETGALGAAAFTWEVVFHHDSHTHPFVQPTTGSMTGSFMIPTQGEVSSNVYYRIRLTVRDPGGASTTVERDIIPETATISIASSPSGAQVTLDGQPMTTPQSVVGVVGMQRTLGVASTTQTLNGSSYAFTSWSDGGATTHTISTPATNTTYTATFDPAPCAYTLSSQSRTVTAGGGAYTVDVTAASGCSWTAVSNDPWLSVTSGATGQGNGTVNYSVQASTGPQRVGTITIAGNAFSVTQTAASGCVYTINPTSRSHASGSGTGGIDVTTTSGCQWTSVPNNSWITLTQWSGQGAGNGTSNYVLAANTGPQRTGSITIAGQTFAVTQAGTGTGCAYSISPTSQTLPAATGSGSIAVTTGSTCAWTATSNNSWITVSGGSGMGNGTTGFSVTANSGATRTGSITAAGQTFSLTQSGGGAACSYSLTPTSRSHAASTGSGSISVTAGSSCAWTASSNNTWITLTSGTSGTGNGTTNYSVAANTGASRSGSITVGGQTFSVTQTAASGCTYVITPSSRTYPYGSTTGGVDVKSGSGCAWTSVSNNSWITLTQWSGNGAGNGTSNYVVAANTGPQRSGSITIAGQTHVVTQNAAGCTYAISPTSRTHTSSGGTGTVSVTAGTGCSWTAQSNNSWVTVTGGASGSGNGTVSYSVAVRSGSTSRTGTITIADKTFTVSQ